MAADNDKVISGDIFPGLLNAQVGKYEEFMGDADVLVPETILDRPRKRLRALENLREELVDSTQEIQRKIINIYNRFRENVYSEQTDEGFLEIEVESYEKCFHVDL